MDKKRRIMIWVVVGGLTILVGGLTSFFSEPAAPTSITLATGSSSGAYAAFGALYAKELEKRGLRVYLRNTAGTGENLRLLRNRQVDVAFVQTGVFNPVNKRFFGHVSSLAALYTEPLWVFYRSAKPLEVLGDLKGKRICIGAKNSGTERVALRILRKNEVTRKNSRLRNCNLKESTKKLKRLRVDAALVISSPRSKGLRKLLMQDKLRLMSFSRYRSYERQLDFLRAVRLWEGSLSLSENIPSNDILLLGASATIAAQKKLHPQVVTALLSVLKTIHKKGNVIDAPNTFPSMTGLDFPLHPAAETFKHSGEGFLAKALPFWALRLLARLKVLLLPLLTILLPAFRLLPVLYRFRVKRLLRKHYEALRECETRILAAEDRSGLEQGLDELLHLKDQLARLSKSIPGAFHHELYHWRLHLDLVRRETEERLLDEELQRTLAAPEMLPSPNV